jgi:GntR family transcriptional regulator
LLNGEHSVFAGLPANFGTGASVAWRSGIRKWFACKPANTVRVGVMEPQPTAVSRPMQLTISDDIRMQIERGELAPGASIPTLQEICDRWSCSVASARAAVALLKEQGLITSGRGKALTVKVPHHRVLRSSNRHQVEKDLVHKPEKVRGAIGTSELETNTPIAELGFRSEYRVEAATEELAEVFGVAVGSELLRREYETTGAKTRRRVAWSVSYLPKALIASNPALLSSDNEPWPGGTQHQLYTVGIEIIKMVDEVEAIAPTTVDRELWGLDGGVPLLKVRRISIDTEDRVVEVSDAVFPADRTKLVFPTQLKPWSE